MKPPYPPPHPTTSSRLHIDRIDHCCSGSGEAVCHVEWTGWSRFTFKYIGVSRKCSQNHMLISQCAALKTSLEIRFCVNSNFFVSLCLFGLSRTYLCTTVVQGRQSAGHEKPNLWCSSEYKATPSSHPPHYFLQTWYR